MANRPRLMQTLLCLLLALPLSAHAEDDKRVSREREALRRTQQALRSAHTLNLIHGAPVLPHRF